MYQADQESTEADACVNHEEFCALHFILGIDIHLRGIVLLDPRWGIIPVR